MGISERKQREKEQRKKLIVDTSKKLFRKHGFDDVTMQMIAESAELAKGTLYLYFKEKNEILYEILFHSVSSLGIAVRDAAQKDGTAHERLESIINVFLSFQSNSTESFFISGIFEALSLKRLSDGSPRFRALMTEYSLLMKTLLDKGQEEGSIRKDIDTTLTALMLVKTALASSSERLFISKDDDHDLSMFSVEELNRNLFFLLLSSLKPVT